VLQVLLGTGNICLWHLLQCRRKPSYTDTSSFPSTLSVKRWQQPKCRGSPRAHRVTGKEPGGHLTNHSAWALCKHLQPKDKYTQVPQCEGFPGGSDNKESACNVGEQSSIPESGKFLWERNGNPLQYSCLENPMDRGAWCATICGVTTDSDMTEQLILLLSPWCVRFICCQGIFFSRLITNSLLEQWLWIHTS